MKSNQVILLVEDNKQDELLTIRSLREHGVTTPVVVCRDGAEALDWIFRRGHQADRDQDIVPIITLLDLKLPKINGQEVLTKIRTNPATHLWPVVVLTSSIEESDVSFSYQNGANSYVQKPVNFKDFSRVIRALGQFWLSVNHPPLIAKAHS